MIEILRNEIRYEGFTLKLCQNVPPSFDCGKKDLNEFFIVDLLRYEEQLLAKTYMLAPLGGKEELPKALISFCNDSIRAESFDNRKDFEKIRKQLPWGKRYGSLPAVKIARLGVQKRYQQKHVGSLLLNMTQLFFFTENRTGCRYITVDAYRTKKAVEFYKSGHFRFMMAEEEEDYNQRSADPKFENEDTDETVALYYNLKWTELP